MLDRWRVRYRRRTCPVTAAISTGITWVWGVVWMWMWIWIWPLANAGADEAGTRARRLASSMTLEEKLDYLGGINGMSIRPVPRLGISR